MTQVRIQVREVGTGKLLTSQLIDTGESKIYVGDQTLTAELKRSLPIAVCRADGEPLVSTFEYPQYEFVCQVCGTLYGYLSPDKAQPTVLVVQDECWCGIHHLGDYWHDPTHGRIDRDIQDLVQERYGSDLSVAQRVAIENTAQNRRDGGRSI